VTHASDDVTLAGVRDDEPDARSRTRAVGPGSVVGRHVVLQTLGAGGMGVVHAAYDPELDRKVALKLLLPGTGGDTGRLRLLREAQALARLSHPNVVGIHDVGTVGEQVWLAMEFVQGRTLRQWLATPRRWPEVLEVLRKAGEGLAAAHAADLLHRDFKPDNVMVGDDGRVRVMDFGLARASSGSSVSESATEPSPPSPEPRTGRASSVTRVGALVGTPGYMAPEQLGGKELSAAADQFAFCVTLWEALYGERPFSGDTSMALVANVLEGKLRSPTRSRGIPSWLRRVCERGLSVEPAQRWPSMGALLDTLAKGRKRATARKGLAAVGVLAVLGAGWQANARWDLAERTATCEASGDEVAVAWNAEREQALRDALVATELRYAATTADKLVPLLEQRAVAWREARVEACLDTSVRKRWSAELLDRSLWCLDERRMELESLVDELIAADEVVVRHAVDAAAGLSSVEPCRDAKTLETVSPPPQEAREALRAVRVDVVRAHNLERSGRYAQGLPLARDALARAEALGWPPLTAAARLRLGGLLDRTGAYPEAEAELERTYFDASKGVAPEVAFHAAVVLAYVVGVSTARHVEGRRWARLADVALEDVPDGQHLHRAALLGTFATIDKKAGALDEAKAFLEQAIALQEATLGSQHPDLVGNLNVLANVHYAAGNYPEATVHYERAIAISHETLGPEHPYLAFDLNNLSNVHYATGNYAEAQTLLERALAIWEATLGPEHPYVASSLVNLSNVHLATGNYAEAQALLERALAIWEATLGPEHPDLVGGLSNLARVHEATGDYDEAKVLAERALAIGEASLGPEHPVVAKSLQHVGTLHREAGDYDGAKALYERAAAIQERALGPEHPDLATTLVGLAEVALAQHRPGDAMPLAERAVAVLDKGAVASTTLAKARFVLARALWEAPAQAGRDRARAQSLAEQARDAFRAAGKGMAELLAEVEAWLAAADELGGGQ
jgi:tetratricopeptide (TPR) repeat protein/predicted Ser/Thr protein kinase